MLIKEEKYRLNGNEVLLRCAEKTDAQVMIDCLKTVTAETRFLMCDSDEINYTLEQEEAFIQEHNASPNSLLLLAFVNGRYAGNCSLLGITGSRKYAHRAGVGIALYQKYTGMGIGTIMMKKLIAEAVNAGYEQCQLTVKSTNERAHHVYRKLGFTECGRMPNADKYTDGTYADDIYMVLDLKNRKLEDGMSAD